jgi:hypothetical protein
MKNQKKNKIIVSTLLTMGFALTMYMVSPPRRDGALKTNTDKALWAFVCIFITTAFVGKPVACLYEREWPLKREEDSES